MPANTKKKARRERRQAVCGVVFWEILWLFPIAIVAAFFRLVPDRPGWLAAMLAVSLLLCLLPMVLALVTLYQRFQEIRRGEEEASRQY